MPDYLVHSSRERARFRHDIFRNPDILRDAMEMLKNEKGVAGLKPGSGSILLLIEPGVDMRAICGRLEGAFPQLAAKRLEMPENSPKAAAPRPKGNVVKKPLTARKRLLRAYLGSGVVTVGLALAGLHHWHAWAGGVFTLLGINHVWERRKAL